MKYMTLSLIALLLLTFAHAQRWESIFGVPGRKDMNGRIVEHYDHGYLISANMNEGYDNTHGWAIKTDINGEVLWHKQIGLLPDRTFIN